MSLFCRHNRFLADCPICSKGTVLDPGSSARRPRATTPRKPKPDKPSAQFSGPHVSAGPYEDEEGVRYVVRLERVPGGVRVAEWAGSSLRRRAPTLPVGDLARPAAEAGEALPESDAVRLAEAVHAAPADGAKAAGVSRGRSGDFKEELRVELLEDGRVRVARWVLRPGAGWELQEAPPMLPAARYAEALAAAARGGLFAMASDAGPAARP